MHFFVFTQLIRCSSTLIQLFVTSRLDYCKAFYQGLLLNSYWKLQLARNIVAWVLSDVSCIMSVKPFCSQWSFVDYSAVTLLVTGQLPYSIQSTSCHLLSWCTCRFANSTIFINLSFTHLCKSFWRYCTAFSVIAPTLWNGLSEDVRKGSHISVILQNVKKQMFKRVFKNKGTI